MVKTQPARRLIALANSPGGRWARVVGGVLLVALALRLRGPAGFALVLGGLLAGVPALWSRCL
jgi:hypothetical protein